MASVSMFVVVLLAHLFIVALKVIKSVNALNDPIL